LRDLDVDGRINIKRGLDVDGRIGFMWLKTSSATGQFFDYLSDC